MPSALWRYAERLYHCLLVGWLPRDFQKRRDRDFKRGSKPLSLRASSLLYR